MSQTPHQTLHLQLIQIRSRAKAWLDGEQPEGFNPDHGICSGLRVRPHYLVLLYDLLAAWPGGNGSRAYPVPHPTKRPSDAFMDCGAQEKWNPEFEYARNRWALLEWLIEQTKPTEEAT